jgi:predicted DNA-binding transcriptional regulator AlpA
MSPQVLALFDPSSYHDVVIAPDDDGGPFWALSTEPPPASLLWVMRLALDSNFAKEACPPFMAHFGGSVSGTPFAYVEGEDYGFLAPPPPKAHRFVGFVENAPLDIHSIRDLAMLTGIRDRSFYNWTRREDFPEPVRTSPNRWSLMDVEAWLRSPAADDLKGVGAWRRGER